MKKFRLHRQLHCFALTMICISCSKDSGTGTGTGTATVPDVFKKFNSTVTISSDGTTDHY
jgi:hypothetical protein